MLYLRLGCVCLALFSAVYLGVLILCEFIPEEKEYIRSAQNIRAFLFSLAVVIFYLARG